MKNTTAESPWLHSLAMITVSVTGVIGFFELLAAISVSFINVSALLTWLHATTAHELIESPHALIFIILAHVIPAPSLSTALKFITLLWLTIHGITNFSLAYAVLTQRYWIYPLAITSFTILTLYQVYVFVIHPTVFISLFVIVGFLVVWLTILEYRRHRTLAVPEGESTL